MADDLEVIDESTVEVESTTSVAKPVVVEDNVEIDDSTAVKTVRLTINLLTNTMIFVTVFVCMVYACRPNLTIFKLHIILCVLGFQFFMCQGALVISRYNSWSVFIKRSHRRHVHWVLELIGVACVTAGSVLFMLTLPQHFTTIHGGLGIVAVVSALVSLVNGIITFIAYKLGYCMNITVTKVLHYVTGASTLGLSAASLCFAFDTRDFKFWLSLWFNNDDLPAPILMLITGLFTFLVVLNFVLPEKKIL